MSEGEVCECGCYRQHHTDGLGVCQGPGSKFECGKTCLQYVERDLKILKEAYLKYHLKQR
jgi:hypothetical protein